jgi:hypothetical protein
MEEVIGSIQNRRPRSVLQRDIHSTATIYLAHLLHFDFATTQPQIVLRSAVR